MTEATELRQIETWFDKYYRSEKLSRPITEADLAAASLSRAGWGRDGEEVGKRSLLNAMREGGEKEFRSLRIYFAMWTEETTVAEDSSADSYLKNNKPNVKGVLQISDANFRALTWFTEWPELPKDAFLISCHYRKSGMIVDEVCKTFPIKKEWSIKVDGEVECFTFVLDSDYSDFNYRLSRVDKNVIKKATAELWEKGSGDQSGRVLSLRDAAPILLKHAERKN